MAGLPWVLFPVDDGVNIFVGVRDFSYCVVQSGGDLILFDNVMLWPWPGFTKIPVERCGVWSIRTYCESHETFSTWTENITSQDFAPIAHIYCGNVTTPTQEQAVHASSILRYRELLKPPFFPKHETVRLCVKTDVQPI